MAKYVKRPVVVEAVEYKPGVGLEDGFKCKHKDNPIGICDGERCAIDKFFNPLLCPHMVPIIRTLEGDHEISHGDYIITGVEGERYPCKPDIFEKTYESCGNEVSVMSDVKDGSFDFGTAIVALKRGRKVARKGWNGRGIFIELQTPDEHSKMTHPYIFIDTTGLQTDNKFAPKDRVPWVASQTDMLAEDWVMV